VDKSATSIQGNFPNPFAGGTIIRYDLSSTCDVTLEIQSMQGVVMCSWTLRDLLPGTHMHPWDGRDDQGNVLPQGIYTCRMKAGDYLGTIKMVLTR
jgi:flagellar hook assembly protein FlgD